MVRVAVVVVVEIEDLEDFVGRVLLVLPEAEAELMVEAHATVMSKWAAQATAAAKMGRMH